MLNIPQCGFVRIDGVTPKLGGVCAGPSVLAPGSYVETAVPSGALAQGQELPIAVGQVVDISSKRSGKLVVAWLLPRLIRMEHVRGGASHSRCAWPLVTGRRVHR